MTDAMSIDSMQSIVMKSLAATPDTFMMVVQQASVSGHREGGRPSAPCSSRANIAYKGQGAHTLCKLFAGVVRNDEGLALSY